MASPPLLSVQHLRIGIRTDDGTVTPVEDVSFDVDAGEVLALVGESGSGKSLTAAAVIDLLPPRAAVTGGAIRFRGRDLAEDDAKSRRGLRGREIAMVFQDPMQYLNPVMACGAQVAEAMRVLDRRSAAEASARVLELFAEVGLSDPELQARRYPHELSGGMRQRVLIAMMLARDPALLIADEPTTALDATVQAQILALLRDLTRRRSMALLFITHDLNAVVRTADRAVVLRAGRVMETLPVTELRGGATHPYTRALVASMPGRGTGGVTGESSTARAHELRAASSGTLLAARDITVAYPARDGLFGGRRVETPAVRGVSLDVRAGETLAIVGESGSGKSTLGRALIRLGPVSSGALHWHDGAETLDLLALEGASLRAFRRRAQMVFQDPFASLNPRHSAGDMLAEPLRIHGLADGSAREDRVSELLRSVGLPADAARKYPHQFSGGQRQRLAIARALAVSPRLIVADEPVSALDMTVQAQVLELLEELRGRFGLTYVFISHDLAVVERIADRVLVLHRGVVEEEGTAEEVFGAPRAEYTRELLAAARA